MQRKIRKAIQSKTTEQALAEVHEITVRGQRLTGSREWCVAKAVENGIDPAQVKQSYPELIR